MTFKSKTFSILSALTTFFVGVAVAWLYFQPEQVTAPQEERALQSRENFVETPDLRSSNLLEIPKAQASPSEERKFPDVQDEKTTVAGKLEIIETDHLEWKIALDGKQILAAKGLAPHIDAQIKRRISPFDEVIVLSQPSGTCCEFGRFWFLGLESNGSHQFSKPIGDGFADVPKVGAGKNYVKVAVRGGRENQGESYLPGGEWIFQNGRVRKVK